MLADDVEPRSRMLRSSWPFMRRMNSAKPLERRGMRSVDSTGVGTASWLAGALRRKKRDSALVTELMAGSEKRLFSDQRGLRRRSSRRRGCGDSGLNLGRLGRRRLFLNVDAAFEERAIFDDDALGDDVADLHGALPQLH